MGLLRYLFYKCPETGRLTSVLPATAYPPGAKLPMYSLFVDLGYHHLMETAMVFIERCPQCGGDHELDD